MADMLLAKRDVLGLPSGKPTPGQPRPGLAGFNPQRPKRRERISPFYHTVVPFNHLAQGEAEFTKSKRCVVLPASPFKEHLHMSGLAPVSNEIYQLAA